MDSKDDAPQGPQDGTDPVRRPDGRAEEPGAGSPGTGAEDPARPVVSGAGEDGAAAQGILRRSFIGVGIFLAMLVLLAGRLFWVQAIDPTGRAEKSLEERRRKETLPALRGEILDVGGNVMARSIQRYRIVVDQTAVADFKRLDSQGKVEKVTPEQLVYQLADLLHKSDEDVKKALDGTSRYSVVAEDVTPDVYNSVQNLGATFVSGEAVSKRSYPDGSIAGSVIGYINSEGAQGGIEQQFDSELKGSDGERIFEISADGIRIPVGEDVNTAAVNGQSIRLTLDRDIQYFLQQQVKARTAALSAEWGTGLVMRVKDASIIALADHSMIDPNDYEHAAAGDFAPRAVSSQTEPGSVEKILTISAAIEEGKADIGKVYDVPAELVIDGQTITDSFNHPEQKRTLLGIVADSMNTGTTLIGKDLTKDQRHDWLAKFGIGTPTGIELPNEASGTLAPAADWNVRQQYTVLFGQGVAQTLLQTATAFQAVANNGVQLTPRIVDAVIPAQGEPQVRPVAEGRRVISEKTAAEVRKVMEAVVVQGGATDGKLSGWRMGGKTGTAETASSDGKKLDGFATSFVGVAPIENPQYIVAMLMNQPKGAVGYIGTTAPVARVMEKVLQHFEVPHSTTQPTKYPKFQDGKTDGLTD